MTADEVTTIIDQLCDKLGLAVDSMVELVPELAQMKVAQYTYAMCALGLTVIVMIAIIVIAWQYGKRWAKRANEKAIASWEEDKKRWPELTRDKCKQYSVTDNDAVGVTIVVSVVCLIFAVAAIAAEGWNLVKWLSSPTAAAIEYILSLL
ncbi:MAG: hypothetical protein LUH03_09835 [Oscillospiraceae bacterium]|nr:hypothetical protein [Oscillospiraceae bacterium]